MKTYQSNLLHYSILFLFISCFNKSEITTNKIMKSLFSCDINEFLTYVNLNEISKENLSIEFENACEMLKLDNYSYYKISLEVEKMNETVFNEIHTVSIFNVDSLQIGEVYIRYLNAMGFRKAQSFEANNFIKNKEFFDKINFKKPDLNLIDTNFIFFVPPR